MKKIASLVWALIIWSGMNAQIEFIAPSEFNADLEHANEVGVNLEKGNSLAYLSFNDEANWSSAQFFSYFKETFKLSDGLEFRLRNRSSDELGFDHERYDQYYNGYKIEMSWLNLHLKNNKVESLNGDFVKRSNAELTIGVSEEEALNSALRTVGANVYKWQLPKEEQHLKLETEDPQATYFPKAEMSLLNANLSIQQRLQLCYAFNIYAQEPLGRYKVYISAKDGELIYFESLLHTGDTPGIAITGYSDTVTIITDSVGAYYRLRETGRGNGIETYNLNNSNIYANSTDFIDSNNIWNSFPANPLDRYATDAHLGTEMTYDYFLLIHNRNSIDDSGFALKSYVHYGTNYVNAFWDGQRMTYGDGDGGLYSPLTTLDICGHEVTHGLTDFTSDLIYAYEYGALNESFSDIFGMTVENYARPNNWNWEIGEDIGVTIRSMSNPNQYNDPDTYGGQHWVSQLNCISANTNDYCGVHTNSGVQNYWFYLLATGGSGVNDIADTFSVSGIGIDKAAKIAFRNNTIYLGRTSDYDQARFYSILSAIDLYGACSPEVESVTNAWHAVGVGSAYRSGVSADFVATLDTSYCSAPALVDFNSAGNNVITFNWDFGDGQSSTLPNPVHTYLNPGAYTVSLIADGGTCGSDTIVRNNYIRVDTSFACSYIMGRDNFSNDCQGAVFDAGGLNGNYPLNGIDTFEIAPSGGDLISLFIENIDIQTGDNSFCNSDYLLVYDGDINASIIGKYCSSNLPPDSIVSSTNKLTLVFFSDNVISASGFKARWECRSSSRLPMADFYAPQDTICTGQVDFRDLSNAGVSSWQWDFGDGGVSSERNPTHFYENDGSYSVSLIVSNSLGSDTMIKSNAINVQRLASPQVINDTACLSGTVRLGVNASGPLQWYTEADGINDFFRGSNLSIGNLNADTAFYVQTEQTGTQVIGSPFTIPGSGYFTDTAEAMYFDVFEPIILESVILTSNSAGNRKIELWNSKGELLQNTSVYVPSGPNQVQIGFAIYPDTAYQLVLASSDPGLYVNATGASYPYNMNGLMELTGSSMGSNAYPFFYYWTVRTLSCYSQRAKVEGIVDTSCVLVGTEERMESSRTFNIYPNPASEGFQLSGLMDSDQNISIEIFSLEGKLISRDRYAKALDLQAKFIGQNLQPAVYFIKLNVNGEQKQFKWIKTQ